MDGHSVRATEGGNRTRKRAGRRARGVWLKERAGYWHAHGTIRAGGRSIRLRRGLGLSVATCSEDEAQAALDELVDEIKGRATGKLGRGDPVGVAARAYLGFKRERPLGASTIRIIKEIVRKFGERRLNEIGAIELTSWIDGDTTAPGGGGGRMTGRAAGTRERFLNTVLAFLRFCREYHGLLQLPKLPRDKRARNPNRRARRRVEDLRPDLIRRLFDAAHITLKAQLAVEWATGARVSSVLYGVRVCDLILADGREKIIFRGTKSGEDVSAALPASAVAILKEYLDWRGSLHDREAPLFLTLRRKPYSDNGKAWGGQNKTGFKAARRRAAAGVVANGQVEAERLSSQGDAKGAGEALKRAEADAKLLGRVTQHWFRHLLATRMMRQDPRAAMEQGGWLDIRSVIGYSQDVPEHRQKIVAAMDNLGTDLTQSETPAAPKAM